MGITLILAFFVLYFINPTYCFTWIAPIGWIIYLVFMTRAPLQEKAENGGVLSFGEALKSSFLCFVVGSGISALFNYLMMNYIDPSLIDVAKEAQMAIVESMEPWIGAEGVEQAIADAEAKEAEFTFGQTVLGYCIGVIISIFFALIIAAIVKKNPSSDIDSI